VQFISEHRLLVFLVQLVVLLFAARGAGELFRRIRQPALVGEILVGLVFGPTILGRFFPGLAATLFPPDAVQHAMLETVSWLGVLFLLLVVGFEVEISAIWKQRRSSLTIGFVGVLLPLLMGVGLALLLPERYRVVSHSKFVFALFLGTAVAISAMAVIARALHDLDILKSDIGLTIISAVTVNDVLGWVAFTIVLGLATQQGLDWFSILKVLGGTALFIAFSLTLGRKLVNKAAVWMNRSRLPKPGIILTFIFLLGGLCAVMSQVIGIHAALGFFFAGVMAGGAPAISERSRETISQMVYAVFVPLFFVSIGLRVDFMANFDLLLVLAVTGVAIGGKFAGAWLGARASAIGGRDAVALGIAHTPGGAMEILIGVLALEFGLINLVVFEAIVVAAIVSSILIGPLLSLALQLRRAFNALAYLLSDAVVFKLAARTPLEAIAELCASVAEREDMPDAAALRAAVVAREEVMSTGLEHGIAIPHARIPGLARPVFTFGRCSRGIDWNTPDGLAVKLVFLILTPEPDTEEVQVKLLAGVARALSDAQLRRAVTEAATREEMLDVFSAALRRDWLARAAKRSGK